MVKFNKIAVFGGTGFVGNYIVDELLAQGFCPHVLVRQNHEEKLNQAEKCVTYTGDIEDESVISEMIEIADAIIYNIGIIREISPKGITFEKLHFQGVKKTVKLAEKFGVNRYILMSANGVKPHGTAYQKTKYLAEQYLKNSPLDWTIFRPSLIFGDPRGKMELCSQLKQEMIEPPFPAPIFYEGILPKSAGSFTFNPVHGSDVAKSFVVALTQSKSVGKVYEIGGTKEVSWKELIQVIAGAYGKKKWTIPTPVFPIKIISFFLDRFSWFPLSGDQLTMLTEGNTCSSKVFNDYGISPISFDEKSLEYIRNKI